MRLPPTPAAAFALSLCTLLAASAQAGEEKSAKEKAFDKSVETYKAEYPKTRTKVLVLIADELRDAQKRLSEAQQNQLDELAAKAQAEVDELKGARMKLADAAMPLPIEYAPGKTTLFSLDRLGAYLAHGDTLTFLYRNEKAAAAKPTTRSLVSYYTVYATIYATRARATSVTTLAATSRTRTYYVPTVGQKTLYFQGYLANKDPRVSYDSYDGQMLHIASGTVEGKDLSGKPIRNPIVYMFDVKDVHDAAFPPKEGATKEAQIASAELAAGQQDLAAKETAEKAKEEAIFRNEDTGREAAKKTEKAKPDVEAAAPADNRRPDAPATPVAQPAADPVVGTWTIGPWSSTFQADGVFRQSYNGNPESRGTWTRKGNQVIAQGEVGPVHFVHTITLDGDSMFLHYRLTTPSGALRNEGDDRRFRAR